MLPLILVAPLVFAQAAAQPPPKGVRLDAIAWVEAETLLRPETVVVIPLGAAAKEHGPHLRLGNDHLIAEYLTRRVIAAAAVVVAPTIPYHYYPAFVEYPGSTSLALATARDLTADVVRSLARFGPRRFYVLNTGISTAAALEPAAAALAAEGILLRYTDLRTQLARASRNVARQEGGSHADEVETSMMLYIDAAAVDMSKAERDLSPPSRPFRLTRSPDGGGTYSRTGIWGDATRATREKGRVIVEALVEAILGDLEQVRAAQLPVSAPAAAERRAAAPAPTPRPGLARRSACTAGDERTIREIAEIFSVAWANQDYLRLGGLWTRHGDIIHPDGWVERGARVITENRRELFTRREYRHSRHPLTLGIVRCVTGDVAVADGKWELREVADKAGKAVPTMDGLATLVVRRGGGGWRIEAYRYTVNAPKASAPPLLLKRPGYPSGQ